MPKLSRVVTLEEIRAADYNLSPSQFVEVADRVEHRALGEIMANLEAARGERERADERSCILILNQVGGFKIWTSPSFHCRLAVPALARYSSSPKKPKISLLDLRTYEFSSLSFLMDYVPLLVSPVLSPLYDSEKFRI